MVWMTIIAAAVVAFFVTALSGKIFIPLLRRVKYGQTIKDIGPSWHKGKQGTPTMGGIIFIIGIAVSLILCVISYMAYDHATIIFPTALATAKFSGGFFMALLFGIIGFIDDYIKVVKKQNLGLRAKQKLVLQFLAAAAYLVSLYFCGAKTTTYIPFIGTVDLGFFYYIIAAVVIVGIVNAVNLTDGIDGLNASVTFFLSLFVFIISAAVQSTGMSVLSTAVAGGCLGFLVWNFYPAKTFMGDTGSLFLGGVVCAMLFGLDMPILILLLGIIYLAEMFSVILQVLYFKATKGKRLFKMSPIHHHFEMCGWSETKIVTIFSTVTALGGIIALICVIFGTAKL